MNEKRIDHAAEAVNFLGAAVIDTHGDDDRKVAIALVHAQLAVAEQLRIGNLLNASHVGITELGEDGLYVNTNRDYLPTPPVWQIRPDIAAALGVSNE